MNKIISSTVGLLLCGSVYAQDINVEQSKWKLVGATENITNMSMFNAPCVNTVWKYSDGNWKAFSASNSILSTLTSALGSSNIASSISKGEGFWINGAGGCTINTTTGQYTSTSTYSLTSSDLSGKTFKIDANDNDGWVVFVLKSDGTGTETGYYQSGNQEYSEAMTWNISNNKLNITLNSDSSTAYMTFDAKPANTSTGTYIGDDTVIFDISNFGDISTAPDYTGTWVGTSTVNIPSASSQCTWDISITINSSDIATTSATLVYATGLGLSECDGFSSSSGSITNKTTSGFTFNIDTTSSDYIFGGNTFDMSVSGSTASETINFTEEGYSVTRTTSITKQ